MAYYVLFSLAVGAEGGEHPSGLLLLLEVVAHQCYGDLVAYFSGLLQDQTLVGNQGAERIEYVADGLATVAYAGELSDLSGLQID